MTDSGMPFTPLPSIKFINNDEENAQEFLGKTAYYEPQSGCIVLYTKGRHPKDVLRSFAHEMIHHMQNLEGRLNHIDTTNVNEDKNLYQLELEAYSLGNMLFREWENSKKRY
jgi:hypothetical protein